MFKVLLWQLRFWFHWTVLCICLSSLVRSDCEHYLTFTVTWVQQFKACLELSLCMFIFTTCQSCDVSVSNVVTVSFHMSRVACPAEESQRELLQASSGRQRVRCTELGQWQLQLTCFVSFSSVSISHFAFISSLQCVKLFCFSELTMHRAQSPIPGRSDSTELGSGAERTPSASVTKECNSQIRFCSWFSDSSCDFLWMLFFCGLHGSMNISLKAVMFWVMTSTCKPWP